MKDHQDLAAPSLRLASDSDLPAINDIYNHYVIYSTCTYQDEPETLESRRAWFLRHGVKHPITVAVSPVGTILGWGSLSTYHARAAYRCTVENSIYIHHEHQRRGLGSLILKDLIERATNLGHHAIIAAIDGEQAGSIALHERFAFKRVGHFPEVGFKFNRWLDVVYLQLTLGKPLATP